MFNSFPNGILMQTWKFIHLLGCIASIASVAWYMCIWRSKPRKLLCYYSALNCLFYWCVLVHLPPENLRILWQWGLPVPDNSMLTQFWFELCLLLSSVWLRFQAWTCVAPHPMKWKCPNGEAVTLVTMDSDWGAAYPYCNFWLLEDVLSMPYGWRSFNVCIFGVWCLWQ